MSTHSWFSILIVNVRWRVPSQRVPSLRYTRAWCAEAYLSPSREALIAYSPTWYFLPAYFFFLFFLRSIAGRCILSSLASRWHVIALFSWLFLSKFPLSYKVVILYKRGKKIYTSKIVIKKKTLQKLNLYCYVPNYLPVTCLPSSLSYMYTQTFLSLLPVFAETTYTLPSPTVTSLTCSPTIQHPHLPSLANHRLLTYNSLNNNLRLNTSPFLPMNTHPPTAPYLNLPFFRC